MKFLWSVFLFTVCLLVCFSVAWAENHEQVNFGGELTWWHCLLDGEVSSNLMGLSGTTIDYIDDLDIDDTDNVPNFNLFWRFGKRHRVSAAYFKVKYSGSKNLTEAFNYKGYTYQAGWSTSSKFETYIPECNYAYSFFEKEGQRIEGLIGMKYVVAEATIESPNLGLGARQTKIEDPVPVIGLNGQINFRNLSLNCEVSGNFVDIKYVDFQLYDAAIKLSYQFSKNWKAQAGYRFIYVTGATRGDELNFTLQGPTVSITGSF